MFYKLIKLSVLIFVISIAFNFPEVVAQSVNENDLELLKNEILQNNNKAIEETQTEIEEDIDALEKQIEHREKLYETILETKSERIGLLEGNLTSILSVIGLIIAIAAMIAYSIKRKIEKRLKEVQTLVNSAETLKNDMESENRSLKERIQELDEYQEKLNVILNSNEFDEKIFKIEEAIKEFDKYKEDNNKKYKDLSNRINVMSKLTINRDPTDNQVKSAINKSHFHNKKYKEIIEELNESAANIIRKNVETEDDYNRVRDAIHGEFKHHKYLKTKD